MFKVPHIPLWGVIAGALLIRVPFLLLEPVLSPDIYRYAWEGKVQAWGMNPFIVAPDNPTTVALRDVTWGRVVFPSYSAIYPPLAQMLFAAAWLVFRAYTILGLRLVFIAAEAVNVALLVRILRRAGAPPTRVLWYAWNPACAVEFCWSGHLDCLVVTAMLGAWACVQGRRVVAGGACLAAGTLLKFYPAVGLPALLAMRGLGWRRRCAVAALFGTLVAVAYLPYASAGLKLFQSAGEFRARWRFNESGFAAVEAAVSWASGMELVFDNSRAGSLNGYDLLALRADQPLQAQVARRAVELGGLVLLLLLALRRAPFDCTMVWMLGYIIVFSPTVHPWYVLPILVFAASGGGYAWLYLSLAAQLTYLPMLGGSDAGASDALPIRVAEYGPFYLLLALQAAAALRRRRTGAAPEASTQG